MLSLCINSYNNNNNNKRNSKLNQTRNNHNDDDELNLKLPGNLPRTLKFYAIQDEVMEM